MRLVGPGVGLGLGGLFGALTLLHPLFALGLLLAPLGGLGFLLGFGLVLLRGLLLPLPTPPYGAQVEGILEVRGGFTRWEGHRLWVKAPSALGDGVYHLKGRILPPEGPTRPGAFDPRAWLQAQGVRGVLEVEAKSLLGPLPEPPWRARLGEGLSPLAREIAEGLVLGDKRGLEGLYENFQKAGLAHLLALSGQHVNLLAGLLVLLPLGRYRYLLALGAVLGYLALAGPSPSLLRAVLMGGLSLLGLFLGLGAAGVLQALGLALFLQLLLLPQALLSLGLQLSYLAVLGLALVLPALPRPRGPWGFLGLALLTSLGVMAFLAPLLLHRFHFLPLLSPLTHLLALPLVALLLPLGLAKLLLGGILAPLVEPLAQGLHFLARLASQGPLLWSGEIPPWGFALYYLALLPLGLALHRLLPWREGLLLASMPLWVGLLATRPKPLDLWALGGPTYLARMGGGEVLLARGGGKDLPQALRALGVEALEVLLVLPQARGEGLWPLVREIPIGLALLPPRLEGSPLAEELRARGARVHPLRAGFAARVGRGRLEVLGERPYLFRLELGGREVLLGETLGALQGLGEDEVQGAILLGPGWVFHEGLGPKPLWAKGSFRILLGYAW